MGHKTDQEASMYSIHKKPKELLSWNLLLKGDEQQWKILINFYRWRLMGSAFLPEGKEGFKEDIVANVIADIYISRHTFNSAEHMVNHMFAAVRYETKNMLIKKEGRYLFNDEVLSKMGNYLSEEIESLDERKKYEKWKDEAIRRLSSAACRLPVRWKNFILVHLKYGREELPARFRALRIFEISKRNDILNRIKTLMEGPQPNSIYELQEHNMRVAIRRLSKREKQVLVRITEGLNSQQIAEQLKLKLDVVRGITGRVSKKLSGVVTTPDVFGSRMEFIKYIADGKFKELLNSELEGKMNKNFGWRLSAAEVLEIFLLRDEQKLGWGKIGTLVGCSCDTAKKAYLNSGGKARRVRGSKLTIDQVLEMRKLYKKGGYSISAVGRMFKIDNGTAWGILKGDAWKEALYTGSAE